MTKHSRPNVICGDGFRDGGFEFVIVNGRRFSADKIARFTAARDIERLARQYFDSVDALARFERENPDDLRTRTWGRFRDVRTECEKRLRKALAGIAR